MNRNLIRAFVGLLTFAIGVFVSSLFYHPVKVVTLVYDSSSILVATPISSVASPTLSIDSLTTEPLKIRYVGTEITDHNERLRVNFLVQNISNQTVRAFVVSCVRSTATTSGAYLESRSFPEGLRNGASEPFVCYSAATDNLELRVNEVEFMDGTRWSKNQPVNRR
ncbi:MAG TPA: hypothetical protein VKB46_21595 [Pyrinomonadaceae bacterium]|nr:hypothetical protein [Pyrinomonadaceae bacterium]